MEGEGEREWKEGEKREGGMMGEERRNEGGRKDGEGRRKERVGRSESQGVATRGRARDGGKREGERRHGNGGRRWTGWRQPGRQGEKAREREVGD